jgi:hypothetical protein
MTTQTRSSRGDYLIETRLWEQNQINALGRDEEQVHMLLPTPSYSR